MMMHWVQTLQFRMFLKQFNEHIQDNCERNNFFFFVVSAWTLLRDANKELRAIPTLTPADLSLQSQYGRSRLSPLLPL
jgi:hypothetical protein